MSPDELPMCTIPHRSHHKLLHTFQQFSVCNNLLATLTKYCNKSWDNRVQPEQLQCIVRQPSSVQITWSCKTAMPYTDVTLTPGSKLQTLLKKLCYVLSQHRSLKHVLCGQFSDIFCHRHSYGTARHTDKQMHWSPFDTLYWSYSLNRSTKSENMRLQIGPVC